MRFPRFIPLLAAIVLTQCLFVYTQTDGASSKPRLIAQFREKDSNEWYKLTVFLLQEELSKDPGSKAFIRVRNDKGLLKRIQLLRKAAVFWKLDEKRVTYLIADSQDYDTESYIAGTYDEIPTCQSCIIIRASDFDGLDRLFRIRRIARKN